MIPREWSSDIPGVRGTIPGNSQLGVVGLPIPQKAAEEVLEAWYYTRHGRRVVLEAWYYTIHWCRGGLEAWCYTRAAGTEVIHVAATGFQGIPDCIARYNSPRMWRRLAQYQRLLGAAISKGRWHQYQGSVVDGKRLVYWCSKLFTFLYFGYCLNLFINLVTVLICS